MNGAAELLTAALAYAEIGWPVLPLHTPVDGGCSCRNQDCKSVGKHPRTRNGRDDATTDATTIKKWWSQWPSANIGILTGTESGIISLDIDGPAGEAYIEARELPDTAEQITGRGRQNIFRRPSEPTKSKTGLFGPDSKIDVKADGGYIVAPPSLHYTGKNYTWELSSNPLEGQEIAPAPAWLLDMIVEASGKKPAAAPVSSEIKNHTRNATLTSLAGSMRHRGLEPSEILPALLEVNRRCVPPLEKSEVEGIAHGIARYAPADLPDEPSIMEAAQSLTPESPTEEIDAIIAAATKTLGAVARQRVYATIKKNALLPLYAIKQGAASNFEEDEPDQLVLARKVIEKYGAENILCTDGNIYQWKPGGVWMQAQDREVKGRVHEVVEELADVTQNRVGGVLDILKTEVFRPRHAWNEDSDLINFQNVVLRIGRTGATLEPHSREFYHNVQIPIKYDPDAPEPKHLHAFLHSIWPDDPESIGTLQEFFGYYLTSDTRQQKILMPVGPKRSGKGTLARLAMKLFGNHNVCNPTLKSLQTQFGLQPLIDKTLAIISDARLGGQVDHQTIVERLLSISGEDSLSIPRKYLEDYTTKLSTRFMVFSNELPRLADASGALASRVIILKMNTSFLGREDHDLDTKLASELPSILNWAIEGLYRLKGRGYFIQPQSAREAIEELNDLGSPISAFIRDTCVIQPGAEVPCSELYQAWRQWCETQGREHPGTLQTFGRDLRAALPELKTVRHREGASIVRMYCGIGLGVSQCVATHSIVSPTQEDINLEEII